MSDLDRVLVLAGGLSAERDVSLRSGQRVAEALRGIGMDVEVRDVEQAARLLAIAAFCATAALMSALKARASTVSPS